MPEQNELTTLGRIKQAGEEAAESARIHGMWQQVGGELHEVTRLLRRHAPQDAFGGFKMGTYRATMAEKKKIKYPMLSIDANRRGEGFTEEKWREAAPNIKAAWNILLKNMEAEINVTVGSDSEEIWDSSGRRTIEISFPSLQNPTVEKIAEMVDKLRAVVEKIKSGELESTGSHAQKAEKARKLLEEAKKYR